MTSSEHRAPGSRWIRTLPWLAGLLIGAGAHLVWWTNARHQCQPGPEIRIVTVPSPTVHVVVHDERVAEPAVTSDERARERRRARHARRRARSGAAGAMVCNERGCRIRRSFVHEALREPALLGPPPQVSEVREGTGPARLRIDGVLPGSVADLLGLRSGDEILSVGGLPTGAPDCFGDVARRLDGVDRFTLVVEREGQRLVLRHRLIDG